jgi:dihydrofolate reductase
MGYLNEQIRLVGVVAMDRNRVIGKDSDIPWRGKLPADMAHFKRATKGGTVVYGRKTYLSIPEKYRPLQGRRNIVLSTDTSLVLPGVEVVNDPDVILRMATEREIFVLGGSQIYNLFFRYMCILIVTEVETEVSGGDSFFPEILPSNWIREVLSRQEVDARNHFPFNVCMYRRKSEM